MGGSEALPDFSSSIADSIVSSMTSSSASGRLNTGISGIGGSSTGSKVVSSLMKLSSKLSTAIVGFLGGLKGFFDASASASASAFSLSSCSRCARCSSFSFVRSLTFLTGFLITLKRPPRVVPVRSITTTAIRRIKVITAPVLPKSFATSPPKIAPKIPPVARDGAFDHISENWSVIVVWLRYSAVFAKICTMPLMRAKSPAAEQRLAATLPMVLSFARTIAI